MSAPAVDPVEPPFLPGGPHDLEFFLDPMCPFAWQTSVWVRRVAQLRDLNLGWRFISLFVIHEHDDNRKPESVVNQRRARQFHRVLAAVRAHHGNDEVGRLYEAWGRRLWYQSTAGTSGELALRIDIAELLDEQGLRRDLAEAADDDSYDAVLRTETALGLERAGGDLGTPIITYDPPHGRSFFGPVISAAPPDDEALVLYDALRTLASFPGFAELKRTNRPPLELPFFADRPT